MSLHNGDGGRSREKDMTVRVVVEIESTYTSDSLDTRGTGELRVKESKVSNMEEKVTLSIVIVKSGRGAGFWGKIISFILGRI